MNILEILYKRGPGPGVRVRARGSLEHLHEEPLQVRIRVEALEGAQADGVAERLVRVRVRVRVWVRVRVRVRIRVRVRVRVSGGGRLLDHRHELGHEARGVRLPPPRPAHEDRVGRERAETRALDGVRAAWSG